MNLGIAGETALVVGASEGIGFETAKAFAEEGARVLICSRSEAKLAAAAAAIGKATGQTPEFFAADLTRAEDVLRLRGWLGAKVEKLDILVNAVGGSHRALFEELEDADWLASFEFNVLGGVRVIRAMLDLLKAAQGGRVVLLGAAGPRMPYPNQVVSNVSKAGLIALVKTLGAEFHKYGIRVNSVSPGRTLTPLWIQRAEKLAASRGCRPEDVIEEFAEEIPMERFGQPEEIAAMVVFLASHKASYVNCQSILVDGGIARGLL